MLIILNTLSEYLDILAYFFPQLKGLFKSLNVLRICFKAVVIYSRRWRSRCSVHVLCRNITVFLASISNGGYADTITTIATNNIS